MSDVIDAGRVTICRGPAMEETNRRSLGEKWCFRHRGRAQFDQVVTAPVDRFSYYGPSNHVECTHCGALDGDLFPGWVREWDE